MDHFYVKSLLWLNFHRDIFKITPSHHTYIYTWLHTVIEERVQEITHSIQVFHIGEVIAKMIKPNSFSGQASLGRSKQMIMNYLLQGMIRSESIALINDRSILRSSGCCMRLPKLNIHSIIRV